MTDYPTRATESFFGRRKAQKLGGRKQRLMDEVLPLLRLDPQADSPTDISPLFKTKGRRIHLEIGFGGGEHLATQADTFRDINFIGIEPFINGMAKMLGEIDDRGLENIRLYDDDATQILDWLPDNCLDQIDLLYPDPWPKRRNWKRRFVNQKNLARISRVLKPEGFFRFASDIDTYVNWTLQHISQQNHLQWSAQTAGDWRNPWQRWHRTRYEAKAIREGRAPCYLVFKNCRDK
ncbi:MAG: tRNA (guanosine(46)-N7)-methyltransferase TrmB [Hyphomicrobiales bacterium]|nr:MAG: tRNA (guanosine(46)-N7)-methyltransferase TrmB [Hyphomicrobiales bacterium]